MLARAVGVSNCNPAQLRRAVAALERHGVPLAANQVHYSIVHRQPETNGVLDACRQLDVALVAYRPLAGGKVERVYAPAATEPLGDDASPADVALMLGAALETTRADINAAAQAREAGEDRLISLGRTGVRLNARHLAELRSAIEELIEAAREHPDDDGVWTTVLWTVVDREDRHIGKE